MKIGGSISVHCTDGSPIVNQWVSVRQGHLILIFKLFLLLKSVPLVTNGMFQQMRTKWHPECGVFSNRRYRSELSQLCARLREAGLVSALWLGVQVKLKCEHCHPARAQNSLGSTPLLRVRFWGERLRGDLTPK